MKQHFYVGRWVRNIAVVALSVIWLIPTWLMVVNAVTPNSTYDGTPQWIPTGFGFFENVGIAMAEGPFLQAALNSFLYAFVGAGLAVLISTAAGFAVVVMPVKHKTLWFWLIYAGTLLPLQVFALPLFFAASYTDLYDTHAGLIIVYVALCIPFGFFVVRNFLTTLPPEIAEAARLDGAGWITLFTRIHMPLAKSAMAAGFIFQFIFIWNELFFGITLSISQEVQPVMAALAGLQSVASTVGAPATLAMAIVVSAPTIAIFFGFQKFFVSGLSTNV